MVKYAVIILHPLLPWVQTPLFPKTAPSGQMQATDLEGWESITTHVCVLLQGLFTLQGFWQVSEMHASFDGQSRSILHSGVSVTIAKKGKKLFYNSWLQMLFLNIFELRSFLRSAQIVKPSPLRGELQVHLSWWLLAEQVAPEAQGLFWQSGTHSLLPLEEPEG